jgi:hypothetical protein
MSNLFQEVLTEPIGIEEKLFGPSYHYYKNIETPSQVGMSDKGTIQQMGKDINGLIKYVSLLVNGKSRASTRDGPLGNKHFLKTGAKCSAIDKHKDKNNSSTSGQTDRYIYIDNVDSENNPFISSYLGINLNVLNPFSIMNDFLSDSTPPCQEITMQTIDFNNNQSSETHYVTLVDIQNMDPCIFTNGKNPVTGKKCKETFKTGVSANASQVMSDDIMDQIYFASLSCVGIYILYRIMEKSK